jgi:tripartite-type tricarboxylate transporter receptor subunit TctC
MEASIYVERRRCIVKKLAIVWVLLLPIFVATAHPLFAQENYPTKAITFVVPFSPGGSTDLGARALAQFLSSSLGQPVVILNKPGGAATIGGNAVATAKPDGYTLGFLPLSPTIPEAYTYFLGAPYTSKDLKPVSRAIAPVAAITVKTDAPWKSFKDLVEYARKNPGMKYGTTGLGSSSHTLMVTIEKAEGVKFSHITFQGDSDIATAILGRHIPFGLPSFVAVKPQVDAGNLRVLAVYLGKRLDVFPAAPTVAELGYKLPYYPYLGVFAPKGTPDPIIRKLDKTIEQLKDDPTFVEKINSLGLAVTYEGTESFKSSIAQAKTNIDHLFKELGYVK